MERVETPLLLVQPGKAAVFSDWEPYAALRSLQKPVDLIMLQGGTHVMTNPQQRLESEEINVDWFRFWLKGEEDRDSAKIGQYARWDELRKITKPTSIPQN
jgi:dipeptidyl aminopeptidase/acylaminoacyl peptidase